MKERILQILRAKFQGTQTIVLDSVAEHLSKTVTEESQLETAIAGVGPLVTSFASILQRDGDKRVTEAQKSLYQKLGLDENGNPKNPNPQPGGNPNPAPATGGEVPDWLKLQIQQQNEQMLNLQKLLTGVVATQTATQKQTQARELLSKTTLPKALQDKWISRIDVTSDTSIEDQVKALEQEGIELQQMTINEAVSRGDYAPSTSKPIASDDELVKIISESGKDDTKVGVAPLSV